MKLKEKLFPSLSEKSFESTKDLLRIYYLKSRKPIYSGGYPRVILYVSHSFATCLETFIIWLSTQMSSRTCVLYASDMLCHLKFNAVNDVAEIASSQGKKLFQSV